MKVEHILQAKGSEVFCIGANANLADAVRAMVDHNCGSLMVQEGAQTVGIVTERDILRTCAEETRSLSEIGVAEKMSTELVTGILEDDLGDVMGLLTERRIRHLPIMDGPSLVGMISIGDVVKAQHSQLAQENHYLKSYLNS